MNDCIYTVASNNLNSDGRKVQVVLLKQNWSEAKCRKARDRVFRLLKLYHINNSEVVKRDYMDANKEYKRLCRKKCSDHISEISDKFGNVRDSFGNYLSFKIKPYMSAGDISLDVWNAHFSALLTANDTSFDTIYACPNAEDEQLDQPILKEELAIIIKKVKNNKARPHVLIESHSSFTNRLQMNFYP